jgi:hypothetical protein
MSRFIAGFFFGVVGVLPGAAQERAKGGAEAGPVELGAVEIWAPRVANQEGGNVFAMPVTALRFEPRVDVQSRNMAEGQADVAIRGGTFANTGFSVGALAIYDPQTAHYTAELPVGPEMLGAPVVRAGAGQAKSGALGTAGSVGYGWRAVRDGGFAAVKAGTAATYGAEVYAGAKGTGVWAADAGAAWSRSDGTRPFGDHEFSRVNARVQHVGEGTQSDVVVGWQAKAFGWVNLYTPFNSPEFEDIETLLVAANHRVVGDVAGDYWQAGVYFRRNKDDYAFNRFAPVGPVLPFNHETRVTGAGADGRRTVAEGWAVQWYAAGAADEIESTALIHGRFNSRTTARAGVFPERRWAWDGGGEGVVTAGIGFSDTNREGSGVSPVIEVARERPGATWSRVALGWAETSQVASYTTLNSSPTGGLFRGNRDLGRSKAQTLDVAAEGELGGWEVEAGAFVRWDEDLVDWVFRRGVTARAAQAVELRTSGVEMYARRAWARWELGLGYSWLHKDADYGDTTIDGSFYALNFPEHRLTAAVTWRPLPRVEVRLDHEARAQAANPLRVRGGDESVIGALGVYWRPPTAREWVWSLQIDNLWNSTFEELPAVPAARRLVAVGARREW